MGGPRALCGRKYGGYKILLRKKQIFKQFYGSRCDKGMWLG